MRTLLTDKTTADPPWARLYSSPGGASLINRMRKSLAAFLARRAFRRAEAELMALDDRILKDIGLDRSEIGSVLIDGVQRAGTALTASCKWRDASSPTK